MGPRTDPRSAALDEAQVDLEVVIVAYGAFALLRRCLLSLRENVAPSVALRVHVVDNASPDGTADAVAREFPEVRLWRRSSNGGFASGTNVALRATSAPYVLILNPDTEVPAGVVEHLLADLHDDATAGMAGCRLELLDGSPDHAAKRSIPSPLQALDYFVSRSTGRDLAYLAPGVDERGVGYVEAINGAFMLVDALAVRDVGLLDEAYWMYGEDLDWCVRFAEAGYGIIYDGRVTALHVKGATSDRTRSLKLIWHFHKSMAIFYRAHQSRGNPVVDLAVHLGIAARFAWLSSKSAGLRLLGRPPRPQPARPLDEPAASRLS